MITLAAKYPHGVIIGHLELRLLERAAGVVGRHGDAEKGGLESCQERLNQNLQSRIEATGGRGARVSEGRLCRGVILLLEGKGDSISGIGSLVIFVFRSGCERESRCR